MREPSATLETVLESFLRRSVRDEVQSLQNDKAAELLTPKELAAVLSSCNEPRRSGSDSQ